MLTNLNPKMYKLLLVLFPAFLLSCLNKPREAKHEGPKVDSTTEIIEVPKDLKEISGIAFVNDSVVAAVEDENGVLYFFDLYKKEIIYKWLSFFMFDLHIIGVDISKK